MLLSEIANIIRNIPLKNFDLLSVGATIAAIGILGFVIYITDRKSITNKIFFLFSIITILWSFFNYINYQATSPTVVLWLLRAVIFLGVWHAFTFFTFLYVFPKEKIYFPWMYKFLLIPLVIVTSAITLTPLIFPSIAQLSSDGSVSKTVVAKGIFLFLFVVAGLVLGGVSIFIRKTFKAKGRDRKQHILILIGTVIMFSLLITFNVILPAVFLNVKFIPLGALFIFPFVSFTGYAIYKHRLFNLRTAAVAGLTFALSIVSFSEIIFAQDFPAVIYRSSVFMIVLIISFLMNKFVQTIAEQREQLQVVNEQQTNLLNFITHQVKGFFTKSKYIFSALVEGDYGRLEGKMETAVKEGLRSDNDGIDMVQNVLSAANIKRGTMEYNMAPIDLKLVILDVVSEQKKNAEVKGLSFETDIREGNYNVSGDSFQIKNVIKNLIDNSIKYTPAGKITVSLSKNDGKILFSVKDTGVGLSNEDKKRLFTEGGRGENSQKINTESTGFGLFIAKNIIKAHNGKIWAKSEGEGKGSEFRVELA
jgi:signal transduction histidine kinase